MTASHTTIKSTIPISLYPIVLKLKMMRTQILLALGVFMLFSACKDNQENKTLVETEVDNSGVVSEEDIENLNFTEFTLDQKAQSLVKDWTQYYKLEGIITNLKAGDFSYFQDSEKDLKETFKELKVNTPETAKSPSISARVLVLETKFYKLESLYNLASSSEEELTQSTQELLVAFSNLNLQMNKKVEFDAINIQKPQ
ncbi:hypothetical protein Q4566_14560 [Tamlana sp. 2_MG-2023]|uniref:hypothetical protein n=1 Tax=unclassified Tamlana TaxID=2614803 RepID=UPI0026E2CF6F|nr:MULTISPECIES: hypothetical protein [unclassified Tamlana]MDO6761431.1 hypothetical protein [Tamlana sp. 2_MG-2023]MDO6792125.1 hypothetical protein [Tamlana sp. 1_MG-2023]